ncbi:MAG: (2Fe-2S) ferredoxin domain-containing protein [Kiritimatiellia bacterium]
MSKPKIVICMGSSCFARGNEKNLAFCEKYLADRGLQDEVDCELSGSLCTGACAAGPIVVADGKTYTHVDTGVMKDLLDALFGGAPA